MSSYAKLPGFHWPVFSNLRICEFCIIAKWTSLYFGLLVELNKPFESNTFGSRKLQWVFCHRLNNNQLISCVLNAWSQAVWTDENERRNYCDEAWDVHMHAHNCFTFPHTRTFHPCKNNHLFWLFAAWALSRISMWVSLNLFPSPPFSVSPVSASKSRFLVRVQVLWLVSMRNILQ